MCKHMPPQYDCREGPIVTGTDGRCCNAVGKKEHASTILHCLLSPLAIVPIAIGTSLRSGGKGWRVC